MGPTRPFPAMPIPVFFGCHPGTGGDSQARADCDATERSRTFVLGKSQAWDRHHQQRFPTKSGSGDVPAPPFRPFPAFVPGAVCAKPPWEDPNYSFLNELLAHGASLLMSSLLQPRSPWKRPGRGARNSHPAPAGSLIPEPGKWELR